MKQLYGISVLFAVNGILLVSLVLLSCGDSHDRNASVWDNPVPSYDLEWSRTQDERVALSQWHAMDVDFSEPKRLDPAQIPVEFKELECVATAYKEEYVHIEGAGYLRMPEYSISQGEKDFHCISLRSALRRARRWAISCGEPLWTESQTGEIMALIDYCVEQGPTYASLQ